MNAIRVPSAFQTKIHDLCVLRVNGFHGPCGNSGQPWMGLDPVLAPDGRVILLFLLHLPFGGLLRTRQEGNRLPVGAKPVL